VIRGSIASGHSITVCYTDEMALTQFMGMRIETTNVLDIQYKGYYSFKDILRDDMTALYESTNWTDFDRYYTALDSYGNEVLLRVKNAHKIPDTISEYPHYKNLSVTFEVVYNTGAIYKLSLCFVENRWVSSPHLGPGCTVLQPEDALVHPGAGMVATISVHHLINMLFDTMCTPGERAVRLQLAQKVYEWDL